jgi:hypothetical protein
MACYTEIIMEEFQHLWLKSSDVSGLKFWCICSHFHESYALPPRCRYLVFISWNSYLMECNQTVVVVCCICVVFVFVSMCRLDLISLNVSHMECNQILLYLCACARLIWFEWYFSGVLIPNPSSFPHSVLGYEVLSTVAFVYDDMDHELKFGIWQNMV